MCSSVGAGGGARGGASGGARRKWKYDVYPLISHSPSLKQPPVQFEFSVVSATSFQFSVFSFQQGCGAVGNGDSSAV